MKKGFTMAEIMITVAITLILATIAIATYTQTVDNARQRVCASNQTVLLKAVENYFLTTGVSPATLGDLPPEQVHKAYVEVMQNRDWLTKLAFLVTKFTSEKCAHAQINNLSELVTPAVMRAYGVSADVFRCPADTGGGISYGINSAIRGSGSWAAVPDGLQIIGDCDSYVFGSLSSRHKAAFGTREISISVRKSGEVVKEGHTNGDHYYPPEPPPDDYPVTPPGDDEPGSLPDIGGGGGEDNIPDCASCSPRKNACLGRCERGRPWMNDDEIAECLQDCEYGYQECSTTCQ